MRTLLGIFLLLHGVLTGIIWSAPKLSVPEGQIQPPDPSHSWMFGDVRSAAVVMGLVVGAGLIVAGLGFLTNQTWWPPAAIAAGIGSLVLFAVFFTPWWLAGIGISAAFVIGALRAVPVN